MNSADIRRKYKSNEIIVNNKSNFKSHLVRCQAIMDNIRFDELRLKAMGGATFRALNLAIQLNSNNYDTFELIPKTYSVELLEDKCKRPIRGADRDDFDPDEVDIDASKKTSHIPAIEITVRKNKLELDKIKLTRKHYKDHNLKCSR